MSNDIEFENRQILPRWLSFSDNGAFFSESKFLSRPVNELERENFSHLKIEWQSNNSLSLAYELIASAKTLSIEDDEEIEKAKRLVSKTKKNDNWVFPFSMNQLSGEAECFCEETDYNLKIHQLRHFLRSHPNDGISWAELAYHYLLNGQHLKADRCISNALYADSSNYYILRLAARFYVHKEDPEKAVNILNKSGQILKNPLLLSAEISISEAFEFRSKNVKKSFQLLGNSNYSEKVMTELYATLATMEYNNGSIKSGRKLIEKALVAPNENALAQIEFICNRFDGRFNTEQYNLACQFEANAWSFYRDNNFEASAQNALRWFRFQPLSSRPALLYSYIKLFIFDKYKDAIELIDSALAVSHTDPVLINNKAVAFALMDNVLEADETIRSIHLCDDDSDEKVILATKGLIDLRQGNVEAGIRKYEDSIAFFAEQGDSQRLSRALYYLGNELKRLKHGMAEEYLAKSYAIAQKNNYNDILFKFRINKI